MPGNRVVIRFIGDDNSLKRSLTQLQALAKKSEGIFGAFGDRTRTAFDKVTAGAKAMLSVLAKMAVGGAILQGVKGLVAAASQLSGLLLFLPGGVAMLGAAFATLKVGLSGVADALGGDKEALAKLAPSAREAVVAVNSFSKAWQAVKRDTQDALFHEVEQSVRGLGEVYIPMLQRRLPEIAAGFNVMGQLAANALYQPKARNSIDTILANTAHELKDMPNLLANLTGGFLTLAGASSKRLVGMGYMIDKLSGQFAHWADGFVSSGAFDRTLDHALDGLTNLWLIGKNVASAIGSVWTALGQGSAKADKLAGGSGTGGPLQFLKEMSASIADLFGQKDMQGGFKALGQALSDVAGAAGGVLLAALKTIVPLFKDLQPVVTRVAQAVGSLLVNALHDLGPPIGRFIKEYGPSFANAIEHIGGFIKDHVLPVLGAFIDWLVKNKGEIKKFFDGLMEAARFAMVIVLGTFAAFAKGLQGVFFLMSGLPGSAGKNFGAMSQQAGAAAAAADGLARSIGGVQPRNVEVTQHGAEGAKSATDGLKRSLDGLHDKTIKVYVQAQGLGDVTLNAMAHGRAVGGTVNKGQTYLVGERGPEYLTMPGSGHVTPNHRLAEAAPAASGGRQVTFAGNTADAVATMFMQLIRARKIIID